jgi:hypothetical protein
MEKEKAFKVGDKITYKPMKDCTRINGEHGMYYYGGGDQDGYVGEILSYSHYVEGKQCWKIQVNTRGDGNYGMLECEFLEYTKPTQDLFPIY